MTCTWETSTIRTYDSHQHPIDNGHIHTAGGFCSPVCWVALSTKNEKCRWTTEPVTFLSLLAHRSPQPASATAAGLVSTCFVIMSSQQQPSAPPSSTAQPIPTSSTQDSASVPVTSPPPATPVVRPSLWILPSPDQPTADPFLSPEESVVLLSYTYN